MERVGAAGKSWHNRVLVCEERTQTSEPKRKNVYVHKYFICSEQCKRFVIKSSRSIIFCKYCIVLSLSAGAHTFKQSTKFSRLRFAKQRAIVLCEYSGSNQNICTSVEYHLNNNNSFCDLVHCETKIIMLYGKKVCRVLIYIHKIGHDPLIHLRANLVLLS